MASNSNLIFPVDGYVPNGIGFDGYVNSFKGSWSNKRSAISSCISIVFTNTISDGYSPTGSLIIQTSNAPEKDGATLGGGCPRPMLGQINGDPVDVSNYPTTPISISTNGVYKIDVTTACHWIRVIYHSTADVSGLQVFGYINSPYVSR